MNVQLVVRSPAHSSPQAYTSGFSLIWALVLTAVLLLLGNTLIQSASAANRTARGTVSDTMNNIKERNALVYATRLLEVNAAPMLRNIPVTTADTEVPKLLQEQVERFCDRTADGETHFRIYFTSTACGTSLPESLSLTNMPVEILGQARHYRIPFVITVQNGDLISRQKGVLSAWRGATPAGTYALLSRENLELNGHLRVKGDVHSDRLISVSAAPNVTGAVSSSNCLSLTSGCTGTPNVNLLGELIGNMNLTPSATRIAALPDATLTLGQGGESAGLSTPTPAGMSLSISGNTLTLGVFGDGGQYLQVCGDIGCTDYGTDSAGNLYRDVRSGTPLIPSWNGVIQVSGLTGMTIKPNNPDANSVAMPLSITGSAPMTVDGSLTYDQSNCNSNICAGSTNAALSITAPTITVTPYTVRLHGAMITDRFITSAPLTIFGSVIGNVDTNSTVFIQADTRADDGYRAPLTPTLSNQWRKVTVQVIQ